MTYVTLKKQEGKLELVFNMITEMKTFQLYLANIKDRKFIKYNSWAIQEGVRLINSSPLFHTAELPVMGENNLVSCSWRQQCGIY